MVIVPVVFAFPVKVRGNDAVVALVVRARVFEPLVMEIEVVVVGGVENVPVTFDAVAFVVIARVLVPLVIEIELLAAGDFEKVPVA